ncbi:hypothetical protein Scep_022147 [Stephania cephalantha]|uniref:Uncharacterized protein n=1 Tax=Stephania cephalantha TaxID=152367 RepID=A0AAP0F9W4_9MAGN
MKKSKSTNSMVMHPASYHPKSIQKSNMCTFLYDCMSCMKWNTNTNISSREHHPSFLLLVMIATSGTYLFHQDF